MHILRYKILLKIDNVGGLTCLFTNIGSVADRKTMEPLPTSMQAHQLLVEEAYERGLIIYSRRTRGGLNGDHFMVCPPLIINAEQIGEMHKMLDHSLEALKAKLNL